MKYKHDLAYLKALLDANSETKIVLESLFYTKANKCIYQSYDEEAFETYCIHLKVTDDIIPLEDCSKCDYFAIADREVVE